MTIIEIKVEYIDKNNEDSNFPVSYQAIPPIEHINYFIWF